MSATYSSFMTTRFYSPVFNTALFDGPLRIYFSQSYENVALRIYHILQTQHTETWSLLKNSTHKSKDHLFLMIYPEAGDMHMVFDSQNQPDQLAQTQVWEEGLAVGLFRALNDDQIRQQVDYLVKTIHNWAGQNENALTT